jgi:hypothetical protein
MHQNLTIFDMAKNRSVRQFSVPERRLSAWAGHAQPIGLFFIDNVTCRCIQCILKSKILQLPADLYIALVFPRGVVTWTHTITEPEWRQFDFTAGAVTQTPDGLILSDSTSGNLYSVSLFNWQSKKFGTASGPATHLFTSQFGSGEFGIVAVSNSVIELFSASGKQTAQSPTESCKSVCLDPFSSTLFCLRRSVVRSYSISPGKIERIGECGFTGVSVHHAKPTNYGVLAICPCRLPVSVHPLFFALCESSVLLIGSSSKVLQQVPSFPSADLTKKINPSIAMAHPTDMSLMIVASGNELLMLDICAHLPQIVPSVPVPESLDQTQVLEGIFNVFSNNAVILVVNRSTSSYIVYDAVTSQKLATRRALDVVLGPGLRHADLSVPPPRKGKEGDSKGQATVIHVYENDQTIRKINVAFPPGFSFPLRLTSFGQFFGVIVGVRPLGLSLKPHRESRTTCLVYKWDSLEPVTIRFDGASSLAFDPPHLAIASPNGYAVFDTEHEMRRTVLRQKRVIHMKFFDRKLYLLTPDGLEIDDLRRVALISSRFSHLLTVERNAPLIPVNAILIDTVADGTVTVVDTRGQSATIGIPEEGGRGDGSLLTEVALAPQPIVAASLAYDNGATEEEVKGMLLLLSNQMGWDPVDPFLSESERAVSELTMNEGDTVLQDEFNEFVLRELEVEPV